MTFDEKKEINLKINNIVYYLIIAVMSILIMAFVPMIGSKADLKWNLPNTTAGWIVWSLSKLLIAGSNMLMFYCFNEQAKVNVKNDENFKKAREILAKAYKKKDLLPRSPEKWNAKVYLSKGTMLFISSAMSCVGLSQAILTFDLVTFLSLLFTIVLGIVFGYLQMKKAEDYWTTEYYEYAQMVQDNIKEEEEEKERMLNNKINDFKANSSVINALAEESTTEVKIDA